MPKREEPQYRSMREHFEGFGAAATAVLVAVLIIFALEKMGFTPRGATNNPAWGWSEILRTQ